MTRRRPRPSRYQTLTELEATLTLTTWLENHIDDWEGPGSPGIEGGTRRRGWISDPTGDTSTRTRPTEADQLVNRAHDFIAAVTHIEELILALTGPRKMLEPLTAGAATEQAHINPGGVGHCEACNEWQPGSSDSTRLRSGFCDACRKAWDRAGRPDRNAFINNRRKAS